MDTQIQFHLVSDIHIEFYDNIDKLIKKFILDRNLQLEDSHARVLLLAGDIGNPYKNNYRLFLEKIAPYYDKVFIVSGNHEYYQKDKEFDKITCKTVERKITMEMVDEQISKVAASLGDKVHFLQRETVIHKGYQIYGCTLWTLSDEKAVDMMSDYEYIQDFSPTKCTSLHQEDVAWLLAELEKTKDLPRIVLTHHLPSHKAIHPDYQVQPYSDYNKYFATPLEPLMKHADVWCCGHTHRKTIIKIGDCDLFINPMGYPSEKNCGYDPNFYFALSPIKN